MSVGTISSLGKRRHEEELTSIRLLPSELAFKKAKTWSEHDERVIKDWLLQGKSATWIKKHAEFEEKRTEAAISTRIAKLKKRMHGGGTTKCRWTEAELQTIKKIIRQNPSASLENIIRSVIEEKIFQQSSRRNVSIHRKVTVLYQNFHYREKEPKATYIHREAWPWPEEEKSLILDLFHRKNKKFADLRDLILENEILTNWDCPQIEKLIKTFQLIAQVEKNLKRPREAFDEINVKMEPQEEAEEDYVKFMSEFFPQVLNSDGGRL